MRPHRALSDETLSSRSFIRFFSDQFLFQNPSDERFLDACEDETEAAKRWPVLAFNAGLVSVTGLAEELRTLRQPALVLGGDAKGKPTVESGRTFVERLPRCRVQRLEEARNVLPWEAPDATCAALAAFGEECSFGGLQWGLQAGGLEWVADIASETDDDAP